MIDSDTCVLCCCPAAPHDPSDVPTMLLAGVLRGFINEAEARPCSLTLSDLRCRSTQTLEDILGAEDGCGDELDRDQVEDLEKWRVYVEVIGERVAWTEP